MERIAGRASLWWDMESCPLPSYVDPYIVPSMAPALLRNFNIIDVDTGGESCCTQHHFSAFRFVSQTETELDQTETELDQTLINSGIRLNQLPSDTTNYEMEKMMMADVLLWAMDTPPPADIIFIVGNVDFCYVFQKLRQRSYNVFLVCQSMSEMLPGMLGGANDCLGWLSFLRSLQNEDRHSNFLGRISVYDHPFSNTALPTSSTSIHSKEMEESISNAAGFNYNRENLLNMNPYLSDDGWNSTCNIPLDETVTSSPVGLLPLPEPAGLLPLPEPGFHDHFIRTKKPRRPVSSASSTEKKKSACLEEFKAWLTRVLNGKKHAEHGYYIWRIRKDFQKASGKILDERSLGFSNTRKLLEECCKDIAMVKEVREGCPLAFPVKVSEQNNHPGSPLRRQGPGRNRVP